MSRQALQAKISALEQMIAFHTAELEQARAELAALSQPKSSHPPAKQNQRRDFTVKTNSQKSTRSRPDPKKETGNQRNGKRVSPPQAEVYCEPYVTEEEWANPEPWEL